MIVAMYGSPTLHLLHALDCVVISGTTPKTRCFAARGRLSSKRMQLRPPLLVLSVLRTSPGALMTAESRGSRGIQLISPADAASPWRADEDQYLLASVPAYTIGNAQNRVTFWTALAASSAVLRERSARECDQHFSTTLAPPSKAQHGREPSLVNGWSRLPDGRYYGRCQQDSREVWLNVAREATLLATDCLSGTRYVELTSGRIVELGPSAALNTLSTSPTPPALFNATASKVWGPLRVFIPGELEDSSSGEPPPWFLKYILPVWGCLFLAEFVMAVGDIVVGK